MSKTDAQGNVRSTGDSTSVALEDQYPILSTSARGGEPTRVLKDGETFAVFDPYGDISSAGPGQHGIYHLGVRHLSKLELRIGRQRPLLLSSTVREDNDVLSIDLTNPDVLFEDGRLFPRDIIHAFRMIFLWRGVLYERLRLVNYSESTCAMSLSIASA